MTRTRWSAVLALSVITLCTFSACTSSTQDTDGSKSEQTSTSDSTSAPVTTREPKAVSAIDPCELLTPDNGAALVGAGAQQNKYGSAHRCEYENLATYATVSVGVDTYDPTLLLYGIKITDTSADLALWASSSSQLVVVEGDVIFTIIVMPASGEYLPFAKQAAVMVLANYEAMN